jgi:hypothetical protein
LTDVAEGLALVGTRHVEHFEGLDASSDRASGLDRLFTGAQKPGKHNEAGGEKKLHENLLE